MTDSSGVEEPTEETGGGRSEEPELRGQYIEGNYGKTGAEPGRHSEDEEGQYSEGDYGADGAVGPLRKSADRPAPKDGQDHA